MISDRALLIKDVYDLSTISMTALIPSLQSLGSAPEVGIVPLNRPVHENIRYGRGQYASGLQAVEMLTGEPMALVVTVLTPPAEGDFSGSFQVNAATTEDMLTGAVFLAATPKIDANAATWMTAGMRIAVPLPPLTRNTRRKNYMSVCWLTYTSPGSADGRFKLEFMPWSMAQQIDGSKLYDKNFEAKG